MTQVQIGDYKKDETYHWDSVLFVVDGYIFRLPKHQFVAGSEYFSQKYRLLEAEPGRVEGCEEQDQSVLVEPASDDSEWLCHQEDIKPLPDVSRAERDPIILKDVSVEEFRTFLKVLYPIQTLTTKCETKLSKDEWISVLRVSTTWFFNELRKAAIQRLTSNLADPIERVCLAREYKVSEWLLSGYTELIKRNSVISETEAHEIGPIVAVRLYIIRGSQGPFDLPDFVDVAIRSKFADELKEISSSALSFRTREERERAEAELKAKLQAEKEEKLRIQKEKEERKRAEDERKTTEEYGVLKQKLEEQRMKLNQELEEVERHAEELRRKEEEEGWRIMEAEEAALSQSPKPTPKKGLKGKKGGNKVSKAAVEEHA